MRKSGSPSDRKPAHSQRAQNFPEPLHAWRVDHLAPACAKPNACRVPRRWHGGVQRLCYRQQRLQQG